MSQWQWGHVRRQEELTCSGFTKQGAPCKLRVRNMRIKEAHWMLNSLARDPLDVSMLQSKLREIVPLLLCKRWHQDQADKICREWYLATCSQEPRVLGRNLVSSTSVGEEDRDSRPGFRDIVDQQDTVPLFMAGEDVGNVDLHTPPPSPRSPMHRPTGQGISCETLRRRQVPWEVSPAQPATLMVENKHGASHSIQIRTFEDFEDGTQISDMDCYICYDEDQEESVLLRCEDCSRHFHLRCMEDFLGNCSRQTSYTCPVWYVFPPLFHVLFLYGQEAN
jgi:hypothetical protein